MFWGLIMEPGRCYTQKVKVSFHVSMASLDISNSTDDPAQVMCVFEGRNYLLCTLNKKDKIQCPLDLNFEAGSKVSFATNGQAHVHLTGYLTELEDDVFGEEQEEEVTKKEKKRIKKGEADGPPPKKSKTIKNSVQEEEEDTDDSEFDIENLMEEDEAEEEESGEEVEEEQEEGDDDEEGEEEADEEAEDEEEETSSLSDEEVEESEEEKEVKPKQNGIAKTNAVLQKKKKDQKQPEKTVPKQKPKKEDKKESQQKGLKKATLKGGVVIQDLKEGAGEPVKDGKFVHVYYEGRLKDNNKMFDSTTKGPGFSFRVGKGEVIRGWDIGLIGMKVGGKRRITCPPKVAYGTDGSPPVIPPNATLVFDVELKRIG